MQTIWLSSSEVSAYGRDFLKRILERDNRPEIWCAITVSGMELACALLPLLAELCPDYAAGVEFWSVGRRNASEEIVRFNVDSEPTDFTGLQGRRVLIIDSAVHSGDTFCRVHEKIAKAGPSGIVTYSLVVKRSSAFYPTYWGCTLGDADRAYFLLDTIPNNRLSTGNLRKDRVIGWSMRRMVEADCDRQAVTCGLGSIDRITWSERFYSMKTNEHGLATFLCEISSTVAGFLTFHHGDKKTLVIDEVAVDMSFHNIGAGGMLLRFAETLARQSNLHAVRLWAIANKAEWYQKCGYKPVLNVTPVKCGDEDFSLMEKTGLYRTFFDTSHASH